MTAPNTTASTANKIALVIDDEPQMRRLLKMTLEKNNFRVFEAASGREGLETATHRRPDIILLDLGLPDMDGQSVLKGLREWSKVPVIILSVRDRESDKVEALDRGANDYVTKPFNEGELLARIRASLRSAFPSAQDAVFRNGPLKMDLDRHIVKVRGEQIKLTAIEYALLRMLVKHAGKVLTQRQIMREVWGPANETQTHYLRIYISHLRDKIETNPSQPELILTEPGIGYRLFETNV